MRSGILTIPAEGILLYDDDRYDSLLDFLHDGKSPVKREILESSCLVMPEATYQRTRELKRLQRRLANLQIANAAFRESWGIRVMSQLRSKLLRKPYPFDEIRDLTHRVTQEEAELRQIIDPLEMSDARFQEYKPCGDQYIRVRPDTSPVLAQRFFGHPRPAAIKPVLERFKSVWDNFRDLQPDPRILGFIAILGATSDFDAEEFRTWDERVLGMLYGPDATPSHPLTHDRFLIHAILYGLPTGAVSDRYIGFRIGWELFRKTWTRHFEHQLPDKQHHTLY